MLCRQPALKPARKCQRKSGCASKRTLAAIKKTKNKYKNIRNRKHLPLADNVRFGFNLVFFKVSAGFLNL